MPQPYLPAFSTRPYSVGFEALKERPNFAAAIGRCINIWSYVDNELGNLFGILLSTNSDAAYRVFSILRRWTNQREALNGAADGRLIGEDRNIYEALLSEYTSLEKQRNDLGHTCLLGAISHDERAKCSLALWFESGGLR